MFTVLGVFILKYIAILILLIISIFALDLSYHLSHYTLVITNVRIVRFPGRKLLLFKSKREEIDLKNVDFFLIDYNGILIAKRAINGVPFYKGDEKQYKSIPIGVQIIHYYLSTEKVSHLKDKILKTLIELLNPDKHPLLADVYVNNKKFKIES